MVASCVIFVFSIIILKYSCITNNKSDDFQICYSFFRHSKIRSFYIDLRIPDVKSVRESFLIYGTIICYKKMRPFYNLFVFAKVS